MGAFSKAQSLFDKVSALPAGYGMQRVVSCRQTFWVYLCKTSIDEDIVGSTIIYHVNGVLQSLPKKCLQTWSLE